MSGELPADFFQQFESDQAPGAGDEAMWKEVFAEMTKPASFEAWFSGLDALTREAFAANAQLTLYRSKVEAAPEAVARTRASFDQTFKGVPDLYNCILAAGIDNRVLKPAEWAAMPLDFSVNRELELTPLTTTDPKAKGVWRLFIEKCDGTKPV